MTAQEVMDLAKEGELKQLVVKDNVSAVIGFINLGLIELYKRFPIETKEFIVTMINGVGEYTLPSDFMWVVSAYGEVPISDTQIVVNQLPINDETDPLSINTVTWNKIQIPSGVTGEYVSLIYVPSPVPVTALTLIDQLPIPEQMIEALLNYIGYRGHGSVDGKISTESNTHYQRFEASVARIRQDGMFTEESLSMINRVIDKGFI